MKFKSPFPEIKAITKKYASSALVWKTTVYALALFGVIVLLLLFLLLNMLGGTGNIVPNVPKNTVLTLDLGQNYPEMRVDDLWAELSEVPQNSFYDLIKAINIAAMDHRVSAIVAKISETPLGLAQIQDLRSALEAFRSTGKKAYLYSAGMGNFGGGTNEYYLASAFDEIWMQPNSEIGITGLNIEIPFFKQLLAKFGVEAEFYARHEYKNAAASLVNSSFSKPYREEMTKLGQGLFSQMVKDIAKSRNISEKDLVKLVNQAPISAERGKEVGLVDKVAYQTALFEHVLDKTKGTLLNISDYIYSIESNDEKVPTVAFVVVDGTISEGLSYTNPMQGENVAGTETFMKQLDDIANNKYVKAVVVRVNSPGGSYTAANEMWNALENLKKKKKLPIVVSMSDYAASGGYFVALAGDKIIAEPSTLTGSIGVLGGKFVLKDLWKKLNVNWGNIKFGDNAGVLSVNQKFSPAEKRAFNASLDRVYKDFTQKVSEARGISLKELDKLARGRVWTGSQAQAKGLVDEIGGIDKAVAWAKKLANIAPKSSFSILYYPKPKTLQEKLAEFMGMEPKIAVNKMISQMGLDIQSVNVLQRLKYDTVLPPFKLNM